jgi:hypothetical protein
MAGDEQDERHRRGKLATEEPGALRQKRRNQSAFAADQIAPHTV